MTVLNVMQCTNLGGMEQVAYKLMDALRDRDQISFRITTPRPFGPGINNVKRIDPLARDSLYRGRFGWRDFFSFRHDIQETSAECSHIWIVGTSAAGLAAVTSLKQPKVLSHHYHHFEGNWPKARWRAFYELLCRQVDVITYPTSFTLDEALRIAPWLQSRAIVVPNGYVIRYINEVDRLERRQRARRALGISDNKLIVGNAGWLIQRKRLDVFLETAALIRKSNHDAEFYICGGGPMESTLKEQAGRLGLADRVHFPGWVENLQAYYEAWDVLLFNSDFDTLPSAPLEAASHGCVVVASLQYGGLNEFIEHGQSGYLFNNHHPEQLAESIIALAEDPGHANNIRRAAIKKLQTNYSIARATNFYKEFFAPNQHDS